MKQNLKATVEIEFSVVDENGENGIVIGVCNGSWKTNAAQAIDCRHHIGNCTTEATRDALSKLSNENYEGLIKPLEYILENDAVKNEDYSNLAFNFGGMPIVFIRNPSMPNSDTQLKIIKEFKDEVKQFVMYINHSSLDIAQRLLNGEGYNIKVKNYEADLPGCLKLNKEDQKLLLHRLAASQKANIEFEDGIVNHVFNYADSKHFDLSIPARDLINLQILLDKEGCPYLIKKPIVVYGYNNTGIINNTIIFDMGDDYSEFNPFDPFCKLKQRLFVFKDIGYMNMSNDEVLYRVCKKKVNMDKYLKLDHLGLNRESLIEAGCVIYITKRALVYILNYFAMDESDFTRNIFNLVTKGDSKNIFKEYKFDEVIEKVNAAIRRADTKTKDKLNLTLRLENGDSVVNLLEMGNSGLLFKAKIKDDDKRQIITDIFKSRHLTLRIFDEVDNAISKNPSSHSFNNIDWDCFNLYVECGDLSKIHNILNSDHPIKLHGNKELVKNIKIGDAVLIHSEIQNETKLYLTKFDDSKQDEFAGAELFKITAVKLGFRKYLDIQTLLEVDEKILANAYITQDAIGYIMYMHLLDNDTFRKTIFELHPINNGSAKNTVAPIHLETDKYIKGIIFIDLNSNELCIYTDAKTDAKTKSYYKVVSIKDNLDKFLLIYSKYLNFNGVNLSKDELLASGIDIFITPEAIDFILNRFAIDIEYFMDNIFGIELDKHFFIYAGNSKPEIKYDTKDDTLAKEVVANIMHKTEEQEIKSKDEALENEKESSEKYSLLKGKELIKIRTENKNVIKAAKDATKTFDDEQKLTKDIAIYKMSTSQNHLNLFIMLYIDVANSLKENHGLVIAYVETFDKKDTNLLNLFNQSGGAIFLKPFEKEVNEAVVNSDIKLSDAVENDVVLFLSTNSTIVHPSLNYFLNYYFQEYCQGIGKAPLIDINNNPHEKYSLYSITHHSGFASAPQLKTLIVFENGFIKFILDRFIDACMSEFDSHFAKEFSIEKITCESLKKSKIFIGYNKYKEVVLEYPYVTEFQVAESNITIEEIEKHNDYFTFVIDSIKPLTMANVLDSTMSDIKHTQDVMEQVRKHTETEKDVLHFENDMFKCGVKKGSVACIKRVRDKRYIVEIFETTGIIPGHLDIVENELEEISEDAMSSLFGHIDDCLRDALSHNAIFITKEVSCDLLSAIANNPKNSFKLKDKNEDIVKEQRKDLYYPGKKEKENVVVIVKTAAGYSPRYFISFQHIPHTSEYNIVEKYLDEISHDALLVLFGHFGYDLIEMLENSTVFITKEVNEYLMCLEKTNPKIYFKLKDIELKRNEVTTVSHFIANKDGSVTRDTGNENKSKVNDNDVNVIFMSNMHPERINICLGADFKLFKEKYAKNKRLYIIVDIEQDLLNKLTDSAKMKQIHRQELLSKDVIVTEDIIKTLKEFCQHYNINFNSAVDYKFLPKEKELNKPKNEELDKDKNLLSLSESIAKIIEIEGDNTVVLHYLINLEILISQIYNIKFICKYNNEETTLTDLADKKINWFQKLLYKVTEVSKDRVVLELEDAPINIVNFQSAKNGEPLFINLVKDNDGNDIIANTIFPVVQSSLGQAVCLMHHSKPEYYYVKHFAGDYSKYIKFDESVPAIADMGDVYISREAIEFICKYFNLDGNEFREKIINYKL